MKCPKCGSNDLKVNEKRDLDAEISIRRRRECLKCGNRFTTYERIKKIR
jgi:transcriptional repressor NrdR